jgi:hypothetical protein
MANPGVIEAGDLPEEEVVVADHVQASTSGS